MIDKFIGAICNENQARLNLQPVIADEDLRVEMFNLAQYSLQIAPINLSIAATYSDTIPKLMLNE